MPTSRQWWFDIFEAQPYDSLGGSLRCKCKFLAREESFDDLFSAMLALTCDSTNLSKYQAAKKAALDAAAVLYPNALEAAASKLADRLKELGVKGVRTDALVKEARHLKDGKLVESSAKSLTAVHAVLADAPVGPQDVVPADWEMSAGGIRFKAGEDASSQISTPVVVSGRHVDVNRKTESLALAWWRDGKWQQRVVDRAAVASTRTVIDALAPYGVPVTSNNSAALVQFLADYEAANLETLPLTRVTRRLGWQGEDGDDGFLCGTGLIVETDKSTLQASPQAVVFQGSDDGDAQIASAFRKRGSYKRWQEAIAALAEYPRAKLALYVAFVPPLLTVAYFGARRTNAAGSGDACLANLALSGSVDAVFQACVEHVLRAQRAAAAEALFGDRDRLTDAVVAALSASKAIAEGVVDGRPAPEVLAERLRLLPPPEFSLAAAALLGSPDPGARWLAAVADAVPTCESHDNGGRRKSGRSSKETRSRHK